MRQDSRRPLVGPKNLYMSSLQRYKKSGGFVQLLSLIETFGPQKREKFLEMIEQESPVWAKALREKMLTFERIFNWPDEVVVDVFKQLQPKTCAFVLHGLKDEQKNRVLPYFSASEKRRMDDVLTESKPKPDEVASTFVKVVELTRKMIQNKELHAEKHDEALIIPEDFEAKLEEQAAHHQFNALSKGQISPDAYASPVPSSPVGSVSGGTSGSPAAPSSPGQSAAVAAAHAAVSANAQAASLEVAQLQRTIAQVLKENKALKEENKALREKLDHIRRMAA